MGCETAGRKIEGIEEAFEVEGRVGAPESKRVVTESTRIKLRFISIEKELKRHLKWRGALERQRAKGSSRKVPVSNCAL